MTQNIPKRSFLVLSATRWTCGRWVIYTVFAHGAHKSVGKEIVSFCSDAEKKLFRTILMGRSGHRKQDYVLGLTEIFLHYEIPRGHGERQILGPRLV